MLSLQTTGFKCAPKKQQQKSFVYSSMTQLLFHALILAIGRSLNPVLWGKNGIHFKFKQLFPRPPPPSSSCLSGSCLCYHHSITGTCSHRHLLESLRLHLVSSPWSTRRLSVFPHPGFKVHRPSLSTFEPLLAAPKDIRALPPDGPSRQEETEMQHQTHQLWGYANPLSLSLLPLQRLGGRLLQQNVALTLRLPATDTISAQRGKANMEPFSRKLTLPLRSPAPHLTPLSTSLQARARTPRGSVLPLTICCFWADYLVIRLLQIKTVAFKTTVSALSFKNS